uniref:hypothetical protein n=1 Tax=Streptomyces asoensis TaxID=249586 RepID=UPI001C0EE835|nr:hypothetical protein [Streptomyces asoensis]
MAKIPILTLDPDGSLVDDPAVPAVDADRRTGSEPLQRARRNRRGGREWVTRSDVVRAPGTVFAFVVGGADHGIVRWDWHFREQGMGSIVQQSWQLLRTDPL